MTKITAHAIEKCLRDTGLSAANSKRIATFIMDEFNAVAGGSSQLRAPREAIHSLAVAVTAMRRAVCASLVGDLPATAPAKWENPADRLPNETPIEFLKRVWGPYIKAGILYQRDLHRLGEHKLVSAIRGYCFRNKLTSSLYLPPPLSVKLDRAFEAAQPGSEEAKALKSRLQARDRSARFAGRAPTK